MLKSRHTISTIPRSNFTILRMDIGPIPIISAIVVTPVEAVVAVVVSIGHNDPHGYSYHRSDHCSLDLGANYPDLSLGRSVGNPPVYSFTA